jgi:hypothetical protein
VTPQEAQTHIDAARDILSLAQLSVTSGMIV